MLIYILIAFSFLFLSALFAMFAYFSAKINFSEEVWNLPQKFHLYLISIFFQLLEIGHTQFILFIKNLNWIPTLQFFSRTSFILIWFLIFVCLFKLLAILSKLLTLPSTKLFVQNYPILGQLKQA